MQYNDNIYNISAASITGITGPAEAKKGVETTFTCVTVPDGETATTYKWLKDNVVISGAGAEEYTFTPTDTTSNGSYTCTVIFSVSGDITSSAHSFSVLSKPF